MLLLNIPAGLAQMAPSNFFWSFCFFSILIRVGQSRRCLAPGIPPGSAMHSHSSFDASSIVISAHIFKPLDILHMSSPSLLTDATTTSAPNLTSVSVMEEVSISSEIVIHLDHVFVFIQNIMQSRMFSFTYQNHQQWALTLVLMLVKVKKTF